jgi:hypothetical protein
MKSDMTTLNSSGIVLGCHVSCRELIGMVYGGKISIPVAMEINQVVQKLLLGRKKIRD